MKAETKTKRILVVEDEKDIRTYLTRFLQEKGYETADACDGEMALDMVRKEKPDLITLDISLQNKSGIKFYREIKGDPGLCEIPVVVVTGVTGFGGSADDFRRFLNTRKQVPPPDGFLSKPVELDELIELVTKLVCD